MFLGKLKNEISIHTFKRIPIKHTCVVYWYVSKSFSHKYIVHIVQTQQLFGWSEQHTRTKTTTGTKRNKC